MLVLGEVELMLFFSSVWTPPGKKSLQSRWLYAEKENISVYNQVG